ncbi:MAG: hypothetical protein HQL29_04840, partial [Candidatus Omnitrophica bacterium]|nr:hypothetical protein [Candidatus Omnitrophota bacterium]
NENITSIISASQWQIAVGNNQPQLSQVGELGVALGIDGNLNADPVTVFEARIMPELKKNKNMYEALQKTIEGTSPAYITWLDDIIVRATRVLAVAKNPAKLKAMTTEEFLSIAKDAGVGSGSTQGEGPGGLYEELAEIRKKIYSNSIEDGDKFLTVVDKSVRKKLDEAYSLARQVMSDPSISLKISKAMAEKGLFDITKDEGPKFPDDHAPHPDGGSHGNRPPSSPPSGGGTNVGGQSQAVSYSSRAMDHVDEDTFDPEEANMPNMPITPMIDEQDVWDALDEISEASKTIEDIPSSDDGKNEINDIMTDLNENIKNVLANEDVKSGMEKLNSLVKSKLAGQATSKDTSREAEAIREMYSQFAKSYSSQDVDGVISFLSEDWSSSDGSDISDLEDVLENSFDVFDSVEYRVSGIKISPRQDGTYDVSYSSSIKGNISGQGISHEEKADIQEVVGYQNGKMRILKTVSGSFWN